MTKQEKLMSQWIARFEHIAKTATDDKWHYSRMALDDVLTRFNALGIRYHSIEAKTCVYRETVVRGTRLGKFAGCYFRIVRKD